MGRSRRAPAGRPSRIRIIGGAWRRRWLPVPAVGGLRPTADALRETLFNWLQPRLPGARVLDLFAGTGALGLEAASRGADTVLLVERDARAAAQLEANCDTLGAGQVRVRRDDALRVLADPPPEGRPYDLVLVDPPFHKGLVAPVLAALRASGWLHPDSCVYVEIEAEADLGFLAADGWRVERERQGGQARALLLAQAEPDATD
ncbi:16S rRNA (guanine(966)-N(2))-methyltransferase RsmD [Thioalkalivibrio sp. ALJ16]|uniref:16S rRNA (guanine(966)-N(2))-methyltransferase RsmD n=1 Tax=Thioalkalivibrio sp. ALJ16 TaxID=1158762 RepID=UPI00036E3356|nr:16S rRNA (guanine(966)-N(2))-methyltransferase RsmD [Thioalkalivibrio sp. ALJ16]